MLLSKKIRYKQAKNGEDSDEEMAEEKGEELHHHKQRMDDEEVQHHPKRPMQQDKELRIPEESFVTKISRQANVLDVEGPSSSSTSKWGVGASYE